MCKAILLGVIGMSLLAVIDWRLGAGVVFLIMAYDAYENG